MNIRVSCVFKFVTLTSRLLCSLIIINNTGVYIVITITSS